jgi:hypothetical protein
MEAITTWKLRASGGRVLLTMEPLIVLRIKTAGLFTRLVRNFFSPKETRWTIGQNILDVLNLLPMNNFFTS